MVVVTRQYVSSGIAALFISTESVFSELFALLYGQRFRLAQFIGVALRFVGVAVLSSRDARYVITQQLRTSRQA
jgi:drug/metabolite transporter (DMT)-like permease